MALTKAEDARIARVEAAVGQLARQLFGVGNPENLRARGCAELADVLIADQQRERGKG